MDKEKVEEAKKIIAQHEQENINEARVDLEKFLAQWQLKYGVKLEPTLTIKSNGQ